MSSLESLVVRARPVPAAEKHPSPGDICRRAPQARVNGGSNYDSLKVQRG